MLGIIWLGVGLLIFGRWSYVLCRFLREIKSNSHPFSDSLNKKLHQLRDKIRLRKPVSGYLINCNIEPGSFGLISPRIIIPAGLIKELTPGELELVLLHELFHIKHKDNIWSFLQKLFSCAFWFNPIVWWFNRHLIWESEKICDEGVLNFSECNSTYAESILKVTRYCVGRKILGYSGMNDFDLKNRIENIVSFNRKGISKDALNRFLIVIVVTFLVITTAASGFLIHSVKPSFNIFEAYNQNFFSGRHRFDQRGHPGKQSEEDLMAAMKHFKEAIALNPNNALAYSGLADVYNFLPEKVPGINKDDVRAQAEEAVKKALALDPNLAEAHASSGYYKFVFQNDFYGAERDFQRAIELNPEYVRAHHFYAGILRLMGHNDEALAERRIVYELEPNSPHYSGTLAVELAFTRQYDDAINQFQRTIELDSDQVITWFVLGETYLYVNKFEDATRAFVRFAELTGENKEVMQQYVSLIEEHKRSGEPVSPPPELVKELSEIAG